MSFSKRGRNEPCLCGSGRKYKRCCLATPSTETAALDRIARLAPPGEAEAAVEAALAGKAWHGEWNQAKRGRVPPYRPSLVVFGNPNLGWRWILDLRPNGTRQRHSLAREEKIELAVECLGEFGNCPRRKTTDHLTDIETYYAADYVVSRADALGTLIFPLPDDAEMGIVTSASAIHCALCGHVFDAAIDCPIEAAASKELAEDVKKDIAAAIAARKAHDVGRVPSFESDERICLSCFERVAAQRAQVGRS